MTQTALSGGGGLIQTMQKSYSMMDLSTASQDPRLARSQYRDPVIEEAEEEGQLKHYRSEEYLGGHTNPAYSSLARTRPDMVKSNEVNRTTPHNSTFYSLFLKYSLAISHLRIYYKMVFKCSLSI